MASQLRLTGLLAAACYVATTAQAADFRLIRSLSGPSGKVEGAKFVFDQVRNRFVYPQDKSLVVYFEWEAPPGTHVLTAFWKQPDGRTAVISPDVKIESTTNQLNSYWTFILNDSMASGIWTVDVRIDGQPAASQPFEIVAPEQPRVPAEPAAPKPPTMNDIFRDASRSMVWVHKMDAAGRREDTSLGFVMEKNRVVTAFQAIDSAPRLQLEFSDGRTIDTEELVACSRTGDWALIEADTLATPPLPAGDPKLVTVGERLIAFNVENGARVIGGVDISGRRTVAGFGERIQISPALASEAAGGPLLDLWGRAVGILGGSLSPGSRFGHRSMAVSPGLFSSFAAVNAAIPLSALPATVSGQRFTLAALASAAVLTAPLYAMTEFLYGGTALEIAKKAGDPMPRDVSEFSVRDQQIWVYSVWEQKAKLSKGMVSAKIYDEANRLRVTVPPKKISLSSAPSRLAFSFPTAAIKPGISRIDLIWDDRPVWRTFVRLTE